MILAPLRQPLPSARRSRGRLSARRPSTSWAWRSPRTRPGRRTGGVICFEIGVLQRLWQIPLVPRSRAATLP
eukprot:2425479-Pyramimonas_sp.AAC.1